MKMDMSDLCLAFARETNQDLPEATEQLTKLVQRIFFSEPDDNQPYTRDDLILADSYRRLVAVGEALHEMATEEGIKGEANRMVFKLGIPHGDLTVPGLARTAISMGSRIIADSPWLQLVQIADDLNIEERLDVPAELVRRHLQPKNNLPPENQSSRETK